jgi:hypothetical protein
MRPWNTAGGNTKKPALTGFRLGTMTWAYPTEPVRNRQNVQANTAANIASEFKARLDITERSFFKESDYEDVQRLIETAATNSIKTRIPRYKDFLLFVIAHARGG